MPPAIRLPRSRGRPAISPQRSSELRKRYGLDRPVGAQFATFLGGLARGDLGTSIEYGQPVTTLIAERLPATLLLGGAVLLVNFRYRASGSACGRRVRRGSARTGLLTVCPSPGYAMPSFWLGLVVAWLVGVKWHLLPRPGWRTRSSTPMRALLARMADVGRHLVLPALTLSVVSIAGTMRYQRTAMLEVLRLPYILTARAKGAAGDGR